MSLSFDGRGINGPDEYRTRICTFRDAAAGEQYGLLFESAPDLLAALEALANLEVKGHALIDRLQFSTPGRALRSQILTAIAKAKKE
jgi:hypothetical protein